MIAQITTKISDAACGKPWALKNVPPLRAVALKLMRLTTREDVPLPDIISLLRTDGAFSAEVLRLVNSPLIETRREITSLSQAVEALGLERLNTLSITAAMCNFLRHASGDRAVQLAWRHNLATALVCEWLAPRLGIEKEMAYSAGLLHDIGRLALISAHLEEYDQMLALIEDPDADMLLACERGLFGIDHCEGGEWLMRDWGLPIRLQEVARHHHRPLEGEVTDLTALVHVGLSLAEIAGFPTFEKAPGYPLEDVAAAIPRGPRVSVIAEFEACSARLKSQINAAQCSLG